MRVGLDIGSTTIKCAVMDDGGKLIYSAYERHMSHIMEKGEEMLSRIMNDYVPDHKAYLAISGSAGMGLADRSGIPFVQEVFSARVAAEKLSPGTDCIIELGGEDAKILFLTTFNDDEYIVKALTIGAKGYIIKQDFDSIIPSLKAVYGGQTVFGNEVTEKLPEILTNKTGNVSDSSADSKQDISPDKDLSQTYKDMGITEQEFEIIKCVADGLSNKEIADKLFLSEGTVRNYISNILSKLDIRDRTNLAIFYYKNS